MTTVLEAKFSKRYPSGSLIKADIVMPADGFGVAVLFGPSGAGKTTVLRCIAGLEKPDTGTIKLGSDVWFAAEQGICLAPQRRDIGFLAQDYALFPHLTVAKNITFGLDGFTRKARIERMTGLLKMLGLVNLENRYPRHLSGGEQQRVALARAVARGRSCCCWTSRCRRWTRRLASSFVASCDAGLRKWRCRPLSSRMTRRKPRHSATHCWNIVAMLERLP